MDMLSNKLIMALLGHAIRGHDWLLLTEKERLCISQVTSLVAGSSPGGHCCAHRRRCSLATHKKGRDHGAHVGRKQGRNEAVSGREGKGASTS